MAIEEVDVLSLEAGLSFSFSGNDLFHISKDSPSIKVQGGKIYGIYGPNGSGKTTLMNLINGFLCPQKGKITYYHKNKGPLIFSILNFNKYTPIRIANFPVRRIFQVPILSDEFCLIDALMITRRRKHDSLANYLNVFSSFRNKLKEKNIEVGEAVSLLKEFGFNDPFQNTTTLSYGERRIITLLQMLFSHANVLLLDEPFANLNIKIIEKMKEKMRNYVDNKERASAIVLIENRKDYLNNFADGLWNIMNNEILVEKRD